ncbi:creatininase family protein [Caballeronia sp. INDeC2]|uniref:creatininase family protein n=1 Tax=Caballeronia sp. INDeC2 TaxID=2921747 RepID=UPI00202887AB|nr:creatininase family protein [Caballeronia sp. INDeC2]
MSSITHRRWADYTSKAFAALPRERLVAVLPVGAIEQHGPHLPMSVDTATIDGLVDAIVPRLPDDLPALFLPTQSIGKSNEHARYPGTLTLSADTLIRLWSEIGACVAAAGVRKLVLFNSHGGQSSVMDIVARELREHHAMMVVASSWYTLGLPEGLFGADEMKHGIHAGDVETSILLALRPDLVAMNEARHFESLTQTMSARYRHLSIGASGKLGWQTQDLNPAGACGNASVASAQKGHQVIDYVAERFVELLSEVSDAPLAWLDNAPEWQ